MFSFSNGYRLSVFLTLVASAALLVTPATADDWPSVTPKAGPAEQKILEALDDDTRLEFIETPLDQVVWFLKDMHGINIELDPKALDDVGIGTDVPMTRNLKGVSLRSALRLMLRDLELTYEIRNEVLQITTPEAAMARAQLKVYNVSALLDKGETAESVALPLMQALQPAGVSAPREGVRHGMGGMEMGVFGGGGGSGYGEGYPGAGGAYSDEDTPKEDERSNRRSARRVVPFKHLLLVRDTTAGHEEFAHVLKCLADALKHKP